MTTLVRVFALFLAASFAINVLAQPTDRQVAAQFAPVFYQGLGENPRSDYITKFDFDGDWRGDNNWNNAADLKLPLRAFIYYSVSETATHYFIHYAVFHPRDYKGGQVRGLVLSDLLTTGAKIVGDRDPTGLLAEATSAHENDMEGALVVAAKDGPNLANARVEYVETLIHNRFVPYAINAEIKNVRLVRTEGQAVVLYIEPRGHGIQAYEQGDGEKNGKDVIVYKYTGKAGDPEQRMAGLVGYDLVSIQTALWPLARPNAKKKSANYGESHNYGSVKLNVTVNSKSTIRTVKLGSLGSAFLGAVGGRNMARPPWGWFDINRRSDPLGLWYFDPAAVVKRDLGLGEGFSTTYIKLPFWAR
jgi:hypothetical protein